MHAASSFVRCSARRTRIALSLALTGLACSAAFGQAIGEKHKVVPTDGDRFDEFGRALAMDDGLMIVGASHNDMRGIQCARSGKEHRCWHKMMV